jgi:hypothetical protein
MERENVERREGPAPLYNRTRSSPVSWACFRKPGFPWAHVNQTLPASPITAHAEDDSKNGFDRSLYRNRSGLGRAPLRAIVVCRSAVSQQIHGLTTIVALTVLLA